MTIDAILWDYDGTIVNSAPKNLSITKEIIAEVAPRLSGNSSPDGLSSPFKYQVANHAAENWRDLYLNFLGLTADETVAAGNLWKSHQLMNKTPVTVFDGVADTVKALSHVPQGICSQNSAECIHQVLSEHGIDHHFDEIVGYDDVPYDSQKPAPDSGLLCLTTMLPARDQIALLYVGDHQSDIVFARNMQVRLGARATVIAAAVTYSGADPNSWGEKPDWIINAPGELIERLSDFQSGRTI